MVKFVSHFSKINIKTHFFISHTPIITRARRPQHPRSHNHEDPREIAPETCGQPGPPQLQISKEQGKSPEPRGRRQLVNFAEYTAQLVSEMLGRLGRRADFLDALGHGACDGLDDDKARYGALLITRAAAATRVGGGPANRHTRIYAKVINEVVADFLSFFSFFGGGGELLSVRYTSGRVRSVRVI